MIVAHLASALVPAFAFLRRRMAAFAAWRQARRDYQLILSVDEHTLQDLGLTRGDLYQASSIGMFDDPTTILAARAAERAPAIVSTHAAEPVQAKPVPAEPARPCTAGKGMSLAAGH